jgi:diamine N-acetyltransferase
MKKLENDKVLLRALEPEDVNVLFDWENDVSVWPFTSTYIPFNRNTLIQYANSVQDIFAEKQYRFVVVSKEDNRAIGFIDHFDFDPIHQRAGVGILIAGEENRGKGFGKSALQLLVQFGKEILMLHQLFCNIIEENKASIQLFESLGFVKCGTKKSWHKKMNEFHDEHIYQLIF